MKCLFIYVSSIDWVEMYEREKKRNGNAKRNENDIRVGVFRFLPHVTFFDPAKISSMDSGASPAMARVTGSVDPHPADSAVDLTDKVHLLPCVVRYDGPCPVSDYFKTNITGVEVDGLKVKEAFFRGRRLQGTSVPLPNGYRGYVLGKNDAVKGGELEGSDEESNDWTSLAEFQNITYWNHDDMPSHDDPIMRCFHWFTIADALHKPVTEEDLASASNVKHQS